MRNRNTQVAAAAASPTASERLAGEPRIGTTTRQQAGYPLNAFFHVPYTWKDDNGDGLIAVSEVHVSNTDTIFIGPSIPPDQLTIQTGFDLLRRHGITDLVTLLHFRPELIENHFGDGSAFGVTMTYVSASEDFGTAGAVKNAEAHLGGPCLVISGDVLTDFDLSAAIAFHRERQADLTILLTRVENPLQYGVVIAEPDGRISRFLEKPTWSEVFSDTVNTGIYLLEPSVLEWIPARREFDFSKDLFPLMMREERRLFGYVAAGYWRDVGDLLEYRLAHQDILAGAVKVDIPGRKLEGADKSVWLGEGSRVDFTAGLKGAVLIGKNVRVGANARISNSVIGDDSVTMG